MIYLLAIVYSLLPVCVTFYISYQCVSLHALCSCVTWFLAHPACIMHIPNYMLHVCLLFLPPLHPPALQPRVSVHWNAQALALDCFIWPHVRPISARFMTCAVGLFHRIPRQDTIHGCCVWYELCFQMWEQACLGSCKEKPSIFSSGHLLFSPFHIHQLK